MIFKAKVIKGQGLGSKIGFPTANLNIDFDLRLEYGVYFVKIIFENKTYKGLLHFGPKKTISEEISAEVFIKKFNQNIYGEELKIEIVKKIRAIIKFDNIEELKKQIGRDVKKIVESL